MLCLIVFGCQYQCNWLPGKTRLRNDLLCVEWDVKPYTLTHGVISLAGKVTVSLVESMGLLFLLSELHEQCLFLLKNMQDTSSACYNKTVLKRVGVEAEGLTKNYIRLVTAPPTGQGKSGIHF